MNHQEQTGASRAWTLIAMGDGHGATHNHVDNGLILRADIHTLFDLDLLAIEPVSLHVDLAPELKLLPEYRDLEDVQLKAQGTRRPAHAPLAARWKVFCAKWRS